MELQFRVTKQSIKRTDGQTPVSDSVNYLTAEFTFDSSDWDNTTKTATFRSGVSVYTVLLDSNNKCVVPWELIKAGKLKVSVYGDGANEYRITADSVDVPVYASGFSLGEESQHPTPDQYEQLTGALAEKVGVSNLKTINGNSLVGEGDIIIEGGGASIDDVTATTYTVYSSEKVALMVGAKPSINDEASSTASVYSSAETDLLLASKLNTNGVKTINGESIVGEGNITIEGGGAEINDTTASTASVYSSEKTVELIGSAVEANPTIAGTETDLVALQIGNTKYKIPSAIGATINDTTASTATVFSSSKVEIIAQSKLDASIATITGGGANLFNISNSKPNWKPSSSSGATYADGSSVTGTYTTNLIPANSSSKFKINFTSAPSYYRTFFYNSSQVFKGGVNNLVQDTDGYYYIDLSGASVSSYTHICLVFTVSDASIFNNLVVSDYDTFGSAKTIINDLYLSDNNVTMAKDRLGLLSDNILEGKKWAVAGDSFTEGGWASGTAPLIPSGKYAGHKAVYHYLIANRNNMVIQDISKAGRTLAHPSDDSFTNTFADYYQTVANDADYLTIYLGINDSHHRPDAWESDGEDTTGEILLGAITDNTVNTYYGAWNVILTWLITNRPNLKIGIIATNGAETDDYRTATIAIANKYGIPYIDMNGDSRTPCMIRSTNSNIASEIKTLRTTNWRISSSNNHPNADCHAYESTFIEDFLRSL